MLEILAEDIIRRTRFENPWWGTDPRISEAHRLCKPRAYLELFFPLVRDLSVRRAVVLMGPRRVGKTFMIHHAVQALIAGGVPPKSICYFSVDNPIYNGLQLEQLLNYYSQALGLDLTSEPRYIFFDEIQYLRDWEIHLKSLVDTYTNIKVTVSGSAAAALRLSSEESGAGRFTDFSLPPLTFYEYLELLDKKHLVGPPIAEGTEGKFFTPTDIDELNAQFLHYLNFGGYPEVIFSSQIQADPARFIKSDIIDKVLLRDLPSLYGISDIQELNYLFTTLAFNTANEISLGELSQNSGVVKNTIKRYIEYLEAAFLIRRVHRIDRSSKRFNRANFFKVYLTNPSMRAALFSPVTGEDSAMGRLAETAIFSQWFHSADDSGMYYARWNEGEVDMVMLGDDQKPAWAIEVKWSDRYCDAPHELKTTIAFCKANKLDRMIVTSKTKTVSCVHDGIELQFLPASVYCYTVGYNIIRSSLRRASQNKPGR